MITRLPTLFVAGLTAVTASDLARADTSSPIILAQHAAAPEPPAQDTPEQRMQRRFPQPARVGDLIGLPVLDDDDVTIGKVREVVRTADARILLIVSYGGRLGWGARPVAVPIEVVVILGRQIASLDMKPADYAKAPTWSGAGQILSPDEKIRIALGRR